MKKIIFLLIITAGTFYSINCLALGKKVQFSDGSYYKNDLNLEKIESNGVVTIWAINNSTETRCVKFDIQDNNTNMEILHNTKTTKPISAGKSIVGKIKYNNAQKYIYKADAESCNSPFDHYAYCAAANNFLLPILESNKKHKDNIPDYENLIKSASENKDRFEKKTLEKGRAIGLSDEEMAQMYKKMWSRMNDMWDRNPADTYQYVKTIVFNCDIGFWMNDKRDWHPKWDKAFKPPLPDSEIGKY